MRAENARLRAERERAAAVADGRRAARGREPGAARAARNWRRIRRCSSSPRGSSAAAAAPSCAGPDRRRRARRRAQEPGGHDRRRPDRPRLRSRRAVGARPAADRHQLAHPGAGRAHARPRRSSPATTRTSRGCSIPAAGRGCRGRRSHRDLRPRRRLSARPAGRRRRPQSKTASSGRARSSTGSGSSICGSSTTS